MKVFAVLLMAVAAANAYYVPVPVADSAFVKSARTGGSFAYSVAENKGAAFVAPVATPYYAAAYQPYVYNYAVQAEDKPVEVKAPVVEAKTADKPAAVSYYGAYPYSAYPYSAYPYTAYPYTYGAAAYGAAYPAYSAAYPYAAAAYPAYSTYVKA